MNRYDDNQSTLAGAPVTTPPPEGWILKDPVNHTNDKWRSLKAEERKSIVKKFSSAKAKREMQKFRYI